ncbi:MAG TPA: 8-amino-7-oxononanoate synthase [Gammaproteobacteria bacterium]|nr:8-amino-7-oxononanoate synthase [Gammaproteobacteria bacterium]
MNAAQRLDASLRDELETLKSRQLYRLRRIVEGPQQVELAIDGSRCLNFSSNDYLGLAAHPQLAAAAHDALEQYGLGAGAAHLVTGHTRAHHSLEEELAEFTGRPRALLFSSGYMANLGIASALLRRGDRVFEDRLNHASLLDAGLASGARFKRYPHADVATLRRQLVPDDRPTLVMTDGVFSMDGDVAPLTELAECGQAAGAFLMVDDAHGVGVLGATGRGSLEHFKLGMDEVPILMGTLGKALGSFGAFVAGSEALIETLIQRARTYVFTTAPPPALAEASRAALRLARTETWRREKLHGLIQRFRDGARQLGLPLSPSATAIQPLVIGDAAQALILSERLRALGLLVIAIRPPTVPAGSARLRITLTAGHDEQQVDRLLAGLQQVMREPHA